MPSMPLLFQRAAGTVGSAYEYASVRREPQNRSRQVPEPDKPYRRNACPVEAEVVAQQHKRLSQRRWWSWADDYIVLIRFT